MGGDASSGDAPFWCSHETWQALAPQVVADCSNMSVMGVLVMGPKHVVALEGDQDRLMCCSRVCLETLLNDGRPDASPL